MPAKKTVSKKTTQKKTGGRTTSVRRAPARPTVAVKVRKPMVGPLRAIANFWTRYFDFMGRSTRSEFWFGLIFTFVVNWLFMYFIG